MQLNDLKKLLYQANLLIENGYEYIISSSDHTKQEVTIVGSDGSEWQLGYQHILNNIDEYEFKTVTQLKKRLTENVEHKTCKYKLELESGEDISEYDIDMSEADININGSFVVTPNHKFKIVLIKGARLIVREID